MTRSSGSRIATWLAQGLNAVRPVPTALAQREELGPNRRLRILHLAFEDHQSPRRGGGAVRTFEINRRLAQWHDITVVTTRYAGPRARHEDGIEYRQLGVGWGHTLSVISYYLSIPWFLLTHRADLVVEEFAAPMSSVAVPLWTRSPTIAMVGWMFAREKTKKYHLPLHIAEEIGVHLHGHFVAVSQYMEDRIRALNRDATVSVIYAGVEHPSEPPSAAKRRDEILVLGRLELKPKGFDLLLEAFTLLQDLPTRLVIVGDGPDKEAIRALTARLGIDRGVEFIPRVEGNAKWDILSRPRLLAICSRFESFGLVAAEALASGTPVVGFALPSLVEIVTPDCGTLVPTFDSHALAEACRAILANDERWVAMSQSAVRRAARFDWDDAARAQELAYLEAVRAPCASRVKQ